ncbi:MAG: hypothetical protein M1816_003663 [Peltula sp. TS41687]|nr:MAG: hypothetical protein M1816_003663 [Peltula sp. TS41687]
MVATRLVAAYMALSSAATVLAIPLAHRSSTKVNAPEIDRLPSPPSLSRLTETYQDASDTMELPSHISTNDDEPFNLTSPHQSGGQEYIVLFDPDHEEQPEISSVLNKIGLKFSDPDVNHVFHNSRFRGFSGKMKSHCIDALNGMGHVKHVEPVLPVSNQAFRSRPGSTWGLQRISQLNKVSGDTSKMDFTYNFDDAGLLGKGVDIYVLDSGLNIDHQAFGGRAKMGFSKDGPNDLNANSDGSGHGTHAAGIAAGSMVGVASAANVIGVKILGASGSGTSADAVKGLDYVIKQHDQRKKEPGFVGSVASLSWSLPSRSPVVDQIINSAIDAGIHVSVAAGNRGDDACKATPSANGGAGSDGNGGKAVTVGSINPNDVVSDFSNTGQCVDVYAPGEGIISTWIGSDNAVNTLAGTSMACPFVTGLMAYLIARDSRLAQSPALMKETLTSASILKSKLPQGPGSSADLGPLLNNGAWGEASSSSKKVDVTSKINSGTSQRVNITSAAWVPTFVNETESSA